MTPEQKQEFKDLIYQAVQAGKQETSGLVDLVIHKIEPAVEKSIEKYVNGKIRNMDKKLDDYIKDDNAYKVKDMEWKKLANPAVELGNNTRVFGKVGMYLVGVVGAIGGIFLMIKNFLFEK